MTTDDVPDFLRRLWRLPMTPARMGRKSTLDVETVVATAVRLADRGGLEAATLPKVAQELGVTSMSLYRYVGSKQELLQLMIDAASTPTAQAVSAENWRAGLRRWATDLWELYDERPWIVRVPIYRPPAGPNQLMWLDRGLAQLSDSGLNWDRKLMAITVLTGYVRHCALLAQELAIGAAEDGSWANAAGYSDTFATLVSPERFPYLAAMLEAQAVEPAEASNPAAMRDDFESGLELILDGVAANINAGTGGNRT